MGLTPPDNCNRGLLLQLRFNSVSIQFSISASIPIFILVSIAVSIPVSILVFSPVFVSIIFPLSIPLYFLLYSRSQGGQFPVLKGFATFIHFYD